MAQPQRPPKRNNNQTDHPVNREVDPFVQNLHDMAWGMIVYLTTVRPRGRGSVSISGDGFKTNKCDCLDYIQDKMLLKVSRAEQFDEWGCCLRFLAKLLKAIAQFMWRGNAENPHLEKDTLVLVFQSILPFSRADVYNGTGSIIIKTPVQTLALDWNGLFELGGYDDKKYFRKFYKEYITHTDRSNVTTLKYYIFHYLGCHATNLQFFIHYVDYAGKNKRQITGGWPNNREIASTMFRQGSFLQIDENHFRAIALKYYVPSTFSFINRMNDYLVIADHRIPNVEGTPTIKTTIGGTYNGYKGSKLFLLSGTPSIAGQDIIHTADAGSFCIDPKTSFFWTALHLLYQTSGRACLGGNVLQQVNDNLNLRFLSPEQPPVNGCLNLLRALGMPDEDIEQADLEDITGLTGYLTEMCRALLPETYHNRQFRLLLTAGLLVTTQRDMVGNPNFLSQVPHSDFRPQDLAAMEEVGIKVFIALMPLEKGGCFIRVFPGFDPNDAQTYRGRLVFIPYRRILILPAQTLHAGGFRTSGVGNPRMHFYLYLLPQNLEERRALQVIPNEHHNNYINLQEGDTSTLEIFPPETHQRKTMFWCQELEILREFLGH